MVAGGGDGSGSLATPAPPPIAPYPLGVYCGRRRTTRSGEERGAQWMVHPTDAAIFTRDLTKRYGPRRAAVAGLNLAIGQGEIYGFLGPNGAGKTTTLR